MGEIIKQDRLILVFNGIRIPLKRNNFPLKEFSLKIRWS